MREDEPRQRVVRVPGSRRARLTPVLGTDTEPEAAVPGDEEAPSAPASGPKGPNDDRLRQDVPPHY
ncbi:myosin heavy chain [Microbacterium sp. HM58-2]|nr:myosin heavy chain [Microbacterium sp. HM58-2]